jgi:hypothetical protein
LKTLETHGRLRLGVIEVTWRPPLTLKAIAGMPAVQINTGGGAIWML